MVDKKKSTDKPDKPDNQDNSAAPRRSSRLTKQSSTNSDQSQESASPPKRVTRSASRGGKKKDTATAPAQKDDAEMNVDQQDSKGKEKELKTEDVDMKSAEDEEAKELREKTEAAALVLAAHGEDIHPERIFVSHTLRSNRTPILCTFNQNQTKSTFSLRVDLRQNIALLQRAVETIESRFTTRVLRTTASIRRRLNAEILAQAVRDHYPRVPHIFDSLLPHFHVHSLTTDDSRKTTLLHYLGKESEVMDVDETKEQATSVLPETDVYLHLLGKTLSTETVARVQTLNRRTLDQLSARVYFYYARFYELTDRLAEIRPNRIAKQFYNTTFGLNFIPSIRSPNQATLLNLLLRNYFHYNLYEQADKLVSKTAFPEAAGNNQLARYMYYLGRIKALQLDYTASHTHLLQAIRKAPQGPVAAGFQQAVSDLRRFMGDFWMWLWRWFDLIIYATDIRAVQFGLCVVSVRVGDLTQFQEQLVRHEAGFQSDKTYTLILRLRHNVIKTGIRMISLSYSRISLRDICFKLHLDSEEDAEFIVAKAIRDGVIDATLDHDRGFMKSKENVDIYSTNEPQAAFHQRISFCLNLHNESVKAMRFPLNAHRKELASAEEARERERELAKEIAEGDMDEDDDVGDF
ncbi:proteasome regulatory subunit C-terminal-domain-containing protein [Jimgerdemannia flammicorona]|uniref:Proteasome regulatory subunit C-terminal-domain-containing protein n=1 Tax=Jimgerdemannia flammicorona TaxID=994334 RepID=A0A433DB86_9FUNG|nr:proteasome regulatory subunit C-terminal-domain-containing protein [Jimgerdemannia flammicorona]